MTTLIAYVGAAVAEIAGCYAFWVWLRMDKPMWLLLPGIASLLLFVFAIGTAIPLLALGFVSREALMRWRGRMLATGATGKLALGIVLIATGGPILTGYDKQIQTGLQNLSPEWLTEFTTQF